MKPNTAFCLVLTGAAIWLSRTPLLRRRYSVWVAILTAAIVTTAVLTISEYVFNWNAGIDELLFRDAEHLGSSSPPGRFAPGTAIALLLMSGGVLLVDRFPRTSHCLTLCAVLIALIGLLGYFYQLPSVYGAGRFTSLALNTVIGLLALCTGLLASRPDRGLTGLLIKSRHHRSQIHALIAGAVVLPIILGSVALGGERLGVYGEEFTLVFFSVLLIALTVALVGVTGARQLAVERQRTKSEEALRESEDRFRAIETIFRI